MTVINTAIGSNFPTDRDYSTMALWEADDGGGDGLGNDDCNGYCWNDSPFDEPANFLVNFAANSYLLTAATGEEHDGTAGTGVRNVASDNGKRIEIANINDFTLSWIEWDCNQKINSLGDPWVYIWAGDDNFVRNMIIHNGRGNSGVAALGTTGSANRCAFLNNIIYNFDTYGSAQNAYGIYNIASVDNQLIYNNTIFDITQSVGVGTATGLYNATNNADIKIKNNISMGTASTSGTSKDFDFAGTTTDADYNLSSDDTADDGGGSNDLINKTASNQFVSIVGGSEDLHLKSGADAIGAGADLGTTPTGVNIDINGRDRDAEGDTWDIGAHQFVSESNLPNKLIIPLSDNTVSFLGKKVNSGSVVTRAGSASLTNSGKEGLNALLALIAGPQALELLGQKGSAGAAIISQILDDQEVSASGKSGINGAIDQTLSDLVLSALGQKGTTGAIATSLDLIVSLLGFESQVIFSGVIDSALGDSEIAALGNTGATGSVSAQLGNLIALLTGAAGHTGDMSVNILTGVELLAKIGVTGVMDIQLLDNEVQMVEITVSDKIYQILISTKTGQIKILAPKTGSIDISTQQ